MITPVLAATLLLSSAEPAALTATAPDGATLHGYDWGAPHADAPLAVLFHQGEGDGRGEYGPLIAWLKQAGYHPIAWDARGGGDRFGENRTVAALPPVETADYCTAVEDLDVALTASRRRAGADAAVVFGSSYSAAHAFRLAAERPGAVAAIVAASPSSGGPMAACRPGLYLDALADPALVLRPAREMEIPSARAQAEAFEAAGVDVRVIEGGVHGASMLVDARTGADMSGARAVVADWLAEALAE